MRLSDIPSLMVVNGGKELRLAALKLHNYAVINGKASGDAGEAIGKFWDNQAALLKVPTGRPYDGLFLGYGVPDVRAQCYKALSDVRMALTRGGQDKGKQWEVFCDFLATAARSAGGVTEVTLTVSAKSVNLAAAGSAAAAGAEREAGHKGNFERVVPFTVSPAGTKVTIDSSRMMGGSVEIKGTNLIVRPGADDGEFLVMAGDKKVTVGVNIFDRGLSTKSIPDIEVGAAVALPKPFYSPYNDGEHTVTLFSLDPTVAELSSDMVIGRKVGFTRIGAKLVYKDCPELAWSDSSGIDVNAKAEGKNGVTA
ncbi:hypothetical protein BN110_010 [Yersinia phage phiR8-01]|uniref:Uncharacterized protein n=1 Tax=Yersinia phage phiR8-01 TaxID=1206556 RepID=A0A1K2IY12_9CAUD|nr:hypothetical protein HOT05_gp48 [Yersinia phage phiR8-01]SGA03418.1 hypothetical protein BN110_010 [Yersinia phage phiR8-01]